MKIIPQAIATLSLLSLGILAMPTAATAQCLQSDINIQASISGSLTPADQSNRPTMRASGPCSGTVVHTQGTQVRTGGTQPGRQTRTVDSKITAGTGNGTGVDVPPVQTGANVQVDVYNAADRL